MRAKSVALAALALALIGAPAQAQEATQETAQDPAGDTARAAVTRILEAIRLPTTADVLRASGIPVEDVDSAIAGAREENVPPGELAGIFEETAKAVEETGPIENFGAFVQERLRAGLRGRDLAEAIRAEHARRGIGKGKTLESRGRGQGQGAGRPDQGGRPDQAGGPDRGSSQMGGKPDSTGRRGPPMNRGQGGRPDSTPNSARRRSGENGGQG